MIQRGGEVVIRMLENVQQRTIKPLIKATLHQVPVFTRMSTTFTAAWNSGAMRMQVSVIAVANMLGMQDGDGFMKRAGAHVNTMEGFWSLLRSWLRRIEAFHKTTCHCIWASLSLCTT